MREINVYGTGVNAIRFVLLNRDVKIMAFIEGKKQEYQKAFMADAFRSLVPVVPFEDAGSILKNRYTVIASSEDAYCEIKDKLEQEYALVEFEDFEYYMTYRKKIAVAYGNCHMLWIKKALTLSKAFSSIYGFYPLDAICSYKECGGIKSNVFEKCDLFIHQCIWEKNEYGSEFSSNNFIKKIPSKCKIIGVPNLYKMPRFMFPQIVDDDNLQWENFGWFYRDYYIDTNYKHMNVVQIRDMIMDDNLICANDILLGQEAFYEKVRLREKEWDIKILDFLRNRMQEEHLFHDLGHPTNAVMSFIAMKILELLQISSKGLDMNVLYSLDASEVPIYKSVSSTLGLKYNVNVIRKSQGRKLNMCQMDLEEYIKQYIAWHFPQIS